MNCPTCQAEIDQTIVCDNDCGTYFCINGHELWFNNIGRLFKGHSPRCGFFELQKEPLTDCPICSSPRDLFKPGCELCGTEVCPVGHLIYQTEVGAVYGHNPNCPRTSLSGRDKLSD